MREILRAALSFVLVVAPIFIGLWCGKLLWKLSPADRAKLEQQLYAGSAFHPDNLPKNPGDRIG